MTDEAVVPAGQPLSQVERVVDTFVAPSKTFSDILRSANCWLPLVLMAVMTIGWCFSIDKTVGFASATETQMSKNPKQEEAMQGLPPAERADRMALTVKITRISTYFSIICVLIFMVIETLILWGAFNFGLGASTKFSQVFAVVAFAGLPRALIWLLSSIFLFAGVGTDNFDLRNPVGTNLGFYVQDPKWLSTAGQFFDVLGLWSLALLVIGMAIISGKKTSQSATVIVGLWVLILLLVTGISAAFS